MADPSVNRPKHWMIAAWPGMANVAVLAAGYLIQKLGLKPIGNLPPRGHFDIESVDIRNGIVKRPTLPRSLLYSGPAPGQEGVRLTVFVGEAQPSHGAYAFAHELLDRARELGVDRVVTFASMATQLHPAEDPAVFGAATRKDLIADLLRLETKILAEGQIGGLNGVLLGAAVEAGLGGVCLLGEIPFFAAQIPNPKAAKAVLEAFGQMSGVTVDLSDMAEHAAKIDQVLIQMLERMQSGQGEEQDEEPEFEGPDLGMKREDDDEEEGPGPKAAPPEPEKGPATGPEKSLDLPARERIEKLFDAARKDRAKGVQLKKELDRLGVFKQYENRFLDLFKRAG
jgi:predicted ATP-grasp superfamily ATP-dependent carboligase